MKNSGVIDGVKYDRVLLEKAEGAAARNSGLMNLGDVAALWDDASSDGTSTDWGMLGECPSSLRSAQANTDPVHSVNHDPYLIQPSHGF